MRRVGGYLILDSFAKEQALQLELEQKAYGIESLSPPRVGQLDSIQTGMKTSLAPFTISSERKEVLNGPDNSDADQGRAC